MSGCVYVVSHCCCNSCYNFTLNSLSLLKCFYFFFNGGLVWVCLSLFRFVCRFSMFSLQIHFFSFFLFVFSIVAIVCLCCVFVVIVVAVAVDVTIVAFALQKCWWDALVFLTVVLVFLLLLRFVIVFQCCWRWWLMLLLFFFFNLFFYRYIYTIVC